ncbi:alpha/beta fold hydrolase [Microbacterium sp. ASV49]|uniref:Alpha/beta hydrolase n=1 Tax=Microbacterium candidum TaxID=3041922 RepID=A0ABT7N157_9MICO|nr:alpha/beta hydrolase [Microbacterium sp. ASV49]MDL9980439.1 alpha/beta hydrolase [Microbacterium sp. ASV49]
MPSRFLDVASRSMPRLTARAAAGLMLLPGRLMRVRPTQRSVMDAAQRSTLVVGRHRMAVYRWGTGERRILLVHGWNGRSAQFADLIARLSGAATVVAFDAPGHGETRGVTADIGMWIEAIRALDAAYGFDVIVGHSFGGLAARRARGAGLVRGSVVSISAPPSTDAVMQAYAAQVGLPDGVTSAVSERLARRLGPVMAAIAMSPDAGAAAADAAILIVHDRDDRMVPAAAAPAIAAMWPGPSRILLTAGRGHNGILAAPEVLDAVASVALPAPVPAA